MSVRRLTVGLLLAIATLVAAVTLATPRAVAAPDEPDPPSTTPTAAAAGPATTVAVNDFIPEDRDLSECISALPRPGCGSKARGGWRQTLVFAVIVAGLAFIAWRVIRAARRNRREQADRDVQNA